HVRLFYPARPDGSLEERMSGMVAAAPVPAPLPLAVILPGVNCGQDSYRWLAVRLVAAGYAVLTYDLVGELFPGQYGTTPGLDLAACRPDTYGTAPTAGALRSLLEGVAAMAAPGSGLPVAGLVDTGRVALLGHSAGGTVVLQSASPSWFPEVLAAVAIAAHAGVSTVLGWQPGTIVASPATCPVLLVGAELDGVMERSGARYGQDAGPTERIRRTFEESLAESSHAMLVELAGVGHFIAADPLDPTTARSFLDTEPTADQAGAREMLVRVLTDFLDAHVNDDAAALARLRELVRSPPPQTSLVRDRHPTGRAVQLT
ncbi:MAG TPA: hypothetical protein VFN19_10255, partial [Candidatus Nanopelagicales bacterium]|nr:hypothetical protein [Candidatus Nanopelagicales bacterium]